MRGTHSILLVCGDSALAAAIGAAFVAVDLTCVLAETALEAVHQLADLGPAAVVIDLLFPDLDPERLVQHALLCRATHGTAIVLLVANDADAGVWIDRGCAATLSRDADPRRVVATVQGVLKAVR